MQFKITPYQHTAIKRAQDECYGLASDTGEPKVVFDEAKFEKLLAVILSPATLQKMKDAGEIEFIVVYPPR